MLPEELQKCIPSAPAYDWPARTVLQRTVHLMVVTSVSTTQQSILCARPALIYTQTLTHRSNPTPGLPELLRATDTMKLPATLTAGRQNVQLVSA